jgi:exopolysaccharide biosynthesis protein
MRRLVLLLLALLGLSGALHADQVVTQPYVGVTRIERTETLPRPLHMHVVQIDLTAPGLRFKLSPPSGTRETVRQTTLEFLKQEGAQVAINAHFFLPFPSTDTEAWLVGIAVSDGRAYSAFESPEQSYAIVVDAPGLNIDADNRAAVVHRDPRQGDARRVRERVTLWTTVAGSAQIVTDGKTTVPAYEDATHARALLKPGGPNAYGNAKSWYDALTARSAIGLSRDQRTLTLFTVDVRGGSDGMRIGEVADVLWKDYGVWNALNLDGGGSSSMAMEDPKTHERTLVNASSDNPAGRSVGSSLAVFARPVP